MANIPRVRDPGLWVPGSVVLSEEFEAFDEIRPWLINAADGSTHAPTTQIVLGGQGLRVSGPSRFDGITLAALAATGTFTVVDNSTLIVSGGTTGGLLRVDGHVTTPGKIRLNGTGAWMQVVSGSFISVQSGGALDITSGGVQTVYGSFTVDGGTVSLLSGSTTNSSGTFTFGSNTYPALAPARSWQRRSLTIAVCTGTTDSSADGNTTPDSWKLVRGGLLDRIFTKSTTSSANFTVVEFFDLPNGGTFTAIDITSMGADAGTVGMTFPKYQILRWTGSVVETMSVLTNDPHVLGDWTTPMTTTVTVNAHAVIDKSYRYGLKIVHSYYGSLAAGKAYYDDCLAYGTVEIIKP